MPTALAAVDVNMLVAELTASNRLLLLLLPSVVLPATVKPPAMLTALDSVDVNVLVAAFTMTV